ncbi:MAG: hypothetical protein HY304_04165 [candidate division Zixibacteria bacterium]|nr:hypothetical protein [candidate division Zixibacteria bacterium]
MRTLAFDCTGPIVTVGLAEQQKPLGRWDRPSEKGRGNTLDMLIVKSLADVGWRRGDVAGLALVTGPGSLTAMRIGWATASGWAQAAGIPVTGWPTPVVQHRQWAQGMQSQSGGPASPAEITFCLIHHRGDQFCCYTLEDSAPSSRPDAVTLGQWRPNGQYPVRLVGPGILGYRERWRSALGERARLVEDQDAIVGGDTLALWGEMELERGNILRPDQSPLDYGLPPEFKKKSER